MATYSKDINKFNITVILRLSHSFIFLVFFQALNLFMKKCWPLVKNHWKYINLISGRVIYQSDNTLAIDEAKITLKMLKELLPKEHLIDVEKIEARRLQK